MKSKAGLLTAVAILLAIGAIHGLWTDRWAISAEPEASAAKLSGVPMTVGDWQSEPLVISPRELERGAIVDYVGCLFVNVRTKSRLQVFLVCGRPGPISVHTPDICFEGAGYHMTSAPVKISLESLPPSEFWQVKFVKQGAEPQQNLRVFWGWTSDGQWEAPDNPRLEFARSKALFKLYVIHDLPRPGLPPDKDPSLDLLRVLLPELQKCLFAKT